MDAKERALAALVQLAPLLGLPIWAVILSTHSNDWNYLIVYFVPGAFMVAAGLVVALGARIAIRSPFVRAQAADSLRFHAIAGSVVVVICALVALSPLLDRHPLTIENPPKTFQTALALAAVAFGIVLPVVEFVRAVVCGVGTWRVS